MKKIKKTVVSLSIINCLLFFLPDQCPSQLVYSNSVQYQQVSSFETALSIVNMKICADGSRIVFSTGGPEVKVYTINSNGSGFKQVYDFQRTGYAPFVDISEDGEKVIWCDWIGDGAIYIANADGSGRIKLVSELPHPDPVFAAMRPDIPLPPRITRDGTQVFFIHNHRDPRATGVWRVDANGSNLTQVFNYLAMAQQLFTPELNNDVTYSFSNGFDISGNGARIIVGTLNFKLETNDRDRGDAIVYEGSSFYHLGDYAIGSQPFATCKDGNQFIVFKRELNAALGSDEINVYFIPIGTGSPVKVINGLDVFGAAAMTQIADNGSEAIIMSSNGRLPITLVDRITQSRLDLVSIDGISLAALGGFRFSTSLLPSINGNGDRFCFLASSNPPQIWIGEINTNAITSFPAISEVQFNPDFVLVDGSTTATFQAHITSAPENIHTATFEAFKDGVVQSRALKADWPYSGLLLDNGEFGDSEAGDGYFKNNSVRADLPETPVGDYTIRLAAINSTLRQVTMVDVEKFKISDQPVSINFTQANPQKFCLYQNYPNPFNSATRIDFYLPGDGYVEIKIFDITGKEIITQNYFNQAGKYSLDYDMKSFPSGVYFYKIKAGKYSETKKMVLVR
ncbi:MAG TPA: T9SS type A sorting domain-containing protein [bacterium]|nr:T9SS type A sorting domain-containing protein [bacterium]HPN45850.1 T9SS type A sorting domain-containing protein [bacterium]